jgi:hypothetical protein
MDACQGAGGQAKTSENEKTKIRESEQLETVFIALAVSG